MDIALFWTALGVVVAIIVAIGSMFKFFIARLDKRFDELRNELKNDIRDAKQDAAKRFEQIDKRFEQIDHRLERIQDSIQELRDRVSKIEGVVFVYMPQIKSIQESKVRG